MSAKPAVTGRPINGWPTAQQRAYYELCYSDTVPLYTAELLNQGLLPYKSSWKELDATGKQRIQYDGEPAVRYMEYPVLTGLYQYASMTLAKTYTAASKKVSLPVIAEVVMFFNIAALGLALAWLATVWATAVLAGRRIWDAALVAASPLLIFQIFTNFDALATAFAIGGLLAWARRKPILAGVLIGIGIAFKLYPVLLLAPLVLLGLRTGRFAEVRRTLLAATGTWLLVNLPIMVAFPRANGVLPSEHPPWRRYGFAVQRGRRSPVGRVRPESGVLGAAGGAQCGGGRAAAVVLCGNRLHRADRTAAAPGGAVGIPVRGGILVDQQGVESAVLAVAGAAGGAGTAASPNSVGVDDN